MIFGLSIKHVAVRQHSPLALYTRLEDTSIAKRMGFTWVSCKGPSISMVTALGPCVSYSGPQLTWDSSVRLIDEQTGLFCHCIAFCECSVNNFAFLTLEPVRTLNVCTDLHHLQARLSLICWLVRLWNLVFDFWPMRCIIPYIGQNYLTNILSMHSNQTSHNIIQIHHIYNSVHRTFLWI